MNRHTFEDLPSVWPSQAKLRELTAIAQPNPHRRHLDLRVSDPEAARQRLRWIPGLLLEDAERLPRWQERINTCNPTARLITTESQLSSIAIWATEHANPPSPDIGRYVPHSQRQGHLSASMSNKLTIKLLYSDDKTGASAWQTIHAESDFSVSAPPYISRDVESTLCSNNAHWGHIKASYFGNGEASAMALMTAVEHILHRDQFMPR